MLETSLEKVTLNHKNEFVQEQYCFTLCEQQLTIRNCFIVEVLTQFGFVCK